MFGYQQQTRGVSDQCDERNPHHYQRLRLTAEDKAPHHLCKYAHSQYQLEYAREMRSTHLHFYAVPNRIQGEPVHGRVGEIVQGFCNQTGGVRDQAGRHFHHKQDSIDTEQPTQGAGLLLGRDSRIPDRLD